MDTTYKLIGTKLYVVQTQEAEVINFADISKATLIYIQPELLDSYKVLNPDYSALMKPYSYTAISVKTPAWNDEPGPGPEPPTPVERFMAHIIPAHEFGMGEDEERHIAFWNETRNLGHGEVYNNKSDAQYILQDYGSDPDYDYMPTWHVARGDRMFAALDDPGDHPSQAKVIHAWYDRDNTRGIETSDTIKEQNGYWFQTMEFEIGEGHSYQGVYFTIPEEFAEEDFIFIVNENAMITQTIQNWPEGCENNVMIDQWYGSNEHKYYWIPEGIRWSHDTRAWPEEYKSLKLSFYPDGEYHTTGGWLGGPIIVQPSPGFTVSVKPKPSFKDQYFTVEMLEDGDLSYYALQSDVAGKTISYSTDNGESWTDITSTTDQTAFGTFSAGDKILFKGTNNSYGVNASKSNAITSLTATINVYGNIMSLIYGDNFVGQTSFPSDTSYNLCYLFMESMIVDASNLILPVTTLTEGCYKQMFNNCTSLTQAPELPATILAERCYSAMFRGCDIIKAPELPATALANDCYQSMFFGCTNLNYIKAMFTTTPGMEYTDSWVSGVSSTGTFVKNSAATWNVTGENGIPAGWTVETASA